MYQLLYTHPITNHFIILGRCWVAPTFIFSYYLPEARKSPHFSQPEITWELGSRAGIHPASRWHVSLNYP